MVIWAGFKSVFLSHLKGLRLTAVVSLVTAMVATLSLFMLGHITYDPGLEPATAALGLIALGVVMTLLILVTPLFNSASRYLVLKENHLEFAKFEWKDLIAKSSVKTYVHGLRAAVLTVIPVVTTIAIATADSFSWVVHLGATLVLLGLLPFHWHMGFLIQQGESISSAFKATMARYKELFKTSTLWLAVLLIYGYMLFYSIVGLYAVWQPESQSYGAAFILLLWIVATVSVTTLYHTVVVFINTVTAETVTAAVESVAPTEETVSCTIDKSI